MSGIMDELINSAALAHCESLSSSRFRFENEFEIPAAFDSKAIAEIRAGETDYRSTPRGLRRMLERIESAPSMFKYFLDGTRRVYKIDDVSIEGEIYPIVAGQIGVGCCRRDGLEMHNEIFERRLVLVLPTRALRDTRRRKYLCSKLLESIGNSERLKRLNLTFDEVLTYNLDADFSYEAKAIVEVQSHMIEREKLAVLRLADQKKLKQGSYLVKDGSIEYKIVKDARYNLSEERLRAAYDYVLGVSKTFNPLQCFVKRGRSFVSDASFAARLRPFERTPAYLYKSSLSGEDVYFCVWYLRLRERISARSMFDGVVKVEKLLINPEEIESGVESERLDLISAHLLRERNPVCYGADERWANHLYPIYVTESFAKSLYLGNALFLSLF